MTNEEIKDIIEQHQHWIKEDCEGWENMKANLSGTDLSGANLSREVMKRKERMGWYIERICKVLQHLPVTQANEIECRALWNNLQLSHEDIVTKYIDKEAK